MTADDVRARFEAWWAASKYTQVVFASSGTKQAALDGYRAAHADLSGEVRELVEALKLCASVCAGETMSKSGLVRALEAAQAALAKFTQEKP